MSKSLLITVAVLLVSTPVAAQQQVWSATMTAEEFQFESGGVTFVGYNDSTALYESSTIQGRLSDQDFDFRGTTHSILWVYQRTSGERAGTASIGLSPAMDQQDLESLMVTADGERLPVDFYSYVGQEEDPDASTIGIGDLGFRWTDGQHVVLELTTTLPGPVPALPLLGVWSLALLLGVGAYRRASRYRMSR